MGRIRFHNLKAKLIKSFASYHIIQSLKTWSSTITSEKDELDEKHRNVASDNAMLLAKVQELQNSIPELEVKCDTLSEKEEQLRELMERLETEKKLLLTKQDELVLERDSLLKRCEEFTQTIYEYDVEKITMAGKMEEMQNKLEVMIIVFRLLIVSVCLFGNAKASATKKNAFFPLCKALDFVRNIVPVQLYVGRYTSLVSFPTHPSNTNVNNVLSH